MPQRLHFIAKELNTNRVRVRGSEDVNNATAHGKLTALLDHVDPGVGGGSEARREVSEVDALTGEHADGRKLVESGSERLQGGTERSDHKAWRWEPGLNGGLLGVCEAAQRRKARRDRVRARAEALMRKCFPTGKQRDCLWVHIGTEFRNKGRGIISRRGDDHNRSVRGGLRKECRGSRDRSHYMLTVGNGNRRQHPKKGRKRTGHNASRARQKTGFSGIVHPKHTSPSGPPDPTDFVCLPLHLHVIAMSDLTHSLFA